MDERRNGERRARAYSATLADDDSGAYDLMHDGRRVGTILFYEDADTIIKGLRELDGARAWYSAVLDACTVAHIGWDENDPRKTIDALLDWHVQVALDPAVSQAARDLQETLRAELEKANAYNVTYITERNEARQEVARLEEELARTQAARESVAEGATKVHLIARRAIDEKDAEIERLQARVAELTQQEAHWKANHDDLAKRNALLSQRPDLPVDRIPAHAELRALQSASALYADGLSTKKALDLIDRTGTGVTGYVLQAQTGGGACIIHLGAVRWLGDDELREIVHPEAPRATWPFP